MCRFYPLISQCLEINILLTIAKLLNAGYCKMAQDFLTQFLNSAI